MTKREPVGGRELDLDVNDYRGLDAENAGQRWAQEHPLPDLHGIPPGGVAEQWWIAWGMYEAGAAAALLFGPSRKHAEVFLRHYFRALG